MQEYGRKSKPASKYSRNWDVNWLTFVCRTRLRDRGVLHHRDGGSELQPGTVRRGAVWIARGGRFPAGDVSKDAGAGFGAEVKRRIVLGTYVLSGGLLRCLLLKGAEGPFANCRGLPGCVYEGGRDPDAILRRFPRSSWESARTTRSRCILLIYIQLRDH